MARLGRAGNCFRVANKRADKQKRRLCVFFVCRCSLALRELFFLAGTAQTVLLWLFLTRIALEQAGFFEG